jgi:hypothetical protein
MFYLHEIWNALNLYIFGIFLIFATMFILCDGEAAFYDR